MKLRRAQFKNFRVLRDLEIDFATSDERRLTVVRAENASGKTTILNALQWALYGDPGLPEPASEYRLHPIDWDTSDGSIVEVTVTVDFETVEVRNSRSGDPIETQKAYQIVRSATETLSGVGWTRGPSTVRLFEFTETGAVRKDPPEAVVHAELPPELREVFFTDGDRALTFIESDGPRSVQRRRVRDAVQSLLGLDLIDSTLGHIGSSLRDANRNARDVGKGGRLEEVTTTIDDIGSRIEALDGEISDAKDQRAEFDSRVESTQQKVDAALLKGDEEQLKIDIERSKSRLKDLESQRRSAEGEHSRLFRSAEFSCDLLGPALAKGFARLSELRDQGKFPKTAIPVLQDRLNDGVCICGESLDQHDSHGRLRRERIDSLIEDSRSADTVQGILTELYHGAAQLPLEPDEGTYSWLDSYQTIAERRDQLDRLRDHEGANLRSLEVQVDAIGDMDLQELRETVRSFREQSNRAFERQTRAETELAGLREHEVELVRERDNLLRAQERGARISATLEVMQDIKTALSGAYDRITREEMAKVSSRMNDLFLEMIGNDPDQDSTVQRAEVSPEFDILVYGPSGRMLNPDYDLSGAQRRALTIAFVLALTKVSEATAPNVIDTPLGMTSGFVKRSVLRTAIQQSSQIVLFLTRSEIAGCEDILDAEAGRVITLTNSDHYPRIVVNDPRTNAIMALRCNCDHRRSCVVCERRLDADIAGRE